MTSFVFYAAEKAIFYRGCSMDSFYNAIDVNTLTSLSETFPYALTEGARMRCATVATNVGGVPYLIESGITGLLFEPKDDAALAEHMLFFLFYKPEKWLKGQQELIAKKVSIWQILLFFFIGIYGGFVHAGSRSHRRY